MVKLPLSRSFRLVAVITAFIANLLFDFKV